MGKTISATTLRSQLSSLLDRLKAGETHFVIERNNQAEAVLLNIEKFREIMQMLEVLNHLEYISVEQPGLEGLPTDLEDVFPEDEQAEDTEHIGKAARSARSESIEAAAARLGIRLIK